MSEVSEDVKRVIAVPSGRITAISVWAKLPSGNVKTIRDPSGDQSGPYPLAANRLWSFPSRSIR